MYYLGLDPSFDGTGVCLRGQEGNPVYKKITYAPSMQWRIDNVVEAAHFIVTEINRFLKENSVGCHEIVAAVEYPIMATPTGGYLGMLTSKIDSLMRVRKAKTYYLPAVAVQSYTKTNTVKGKTPLVNWYKAFEPTFKGNHDEATAGVLIEIVKAIEEGRYKNSFYLKDYGKESK